jgi:hypothetical protein
MKIKRIVSFALSLGILLYIFSLIMPASQLKLECRSDNNEVGKRISEKMFLLYESFPWWVHLWSHTDGNLFWETSEGASDALLDSEERGSNIIFSKEDAERGYAEYSKISGNFVYYYDNKLVFRGVCKIIDEA